MKQNHSFYECTLRPVSSSQKVISELERGGAVDQDTEEKNEVTDMAMFCLRSLKTAGAQRRCEWPQSVESSFFLNWDFVMGSRSLLH